MGVNGEALQLHVVYKKLYFSLQVTRQSVSGTASHMHARLCVTVDFSYLYIHILCVVCIPYVCLGKLQDRTLELIDAKFGIVGTGRYCHPLCVCLCVHVHDRPLYLHTKQSNHGNEVRKCLHM